LEEWSKSALAGMLLAVEDIIWSFVQVFEILDPEGLEMMTSEIGHGV
jgi:hypothetical protein